MELVEELQLATSRLLLRDFREGELAEVHAIRSDPEVARFVSDLVPETRAESQHWLNEVIFHNRKRPREAYNLAIVHGDGGRVIGWIGIGRSGRYPDAGELGFGYMLNRAYWGQGYATEAVRAILAFGFGALGGQRSSAWCHAANRASARVLEKAGLRFVRTFEQIEPGRSEPIECEEYSISIEEWQSRGDR